MKEFIIFYLVFWWVMSILYKGNQAAKFLEDNGNKLKQHSFLNKWVLGIGRCNFCLENYISSFLIIGYCYYLQDISFWYWGILCASINSWLRTFFK